MRMMRRLAANMKCIASSKDSNKNCRYSSAAWPVFARLLGLWTSFHAANRFRASSSSSCDSSFGRTCGFVSLVFKFDTRKYPTDRKVSDKVFDKVLPENTLETA